jgi:exodeoxyribonuclease III
MRIATWNCGRGPWPTKRALADAIGADITVITEAPRAVAGDGLPWFGNHLGRNGTTVLAGREYRLEPLPTTPGAPCVNAMRVTGPHEFTLLAVWTWPAAPFKNYKEPLLAGLKAYRHLPGPFVIAGDFNGNTRFDRPRSRVKWSSCLAAVEEFGVVSAYHTFFNAGYGEERHPTQYQTRKVSMPFHLDYVFVPASWRSGLREVRVPGFGEFCASDHRPVIVDVTLAPGAV